MLHGLAMLSGIRYAMTSIQGLAQLATFLV
jgi:hypothetical protein